MRDVAMTSDDPSNVEIVRTVFSQRFDDDGEEYLRRMLENIIKHNCDSVKFSRAKSGAPDYMIRQLIDDETGYEMDYQAFSGKTHRALGFEKGDNWKHWSRITLTKSEVSELLGEVRGFERPKLTTSNKKE